MREKREKKEERESKKGKNQTKKNDKKLSKHNNARVFFFSFVREEEELTCITECIDTWF